MMPTLNGKLMVIAWKDSAIVLLISNVFSGLKDPVIRKRKMARESVAIKDKESLHTALSNQAKGFLPIPLIINIYNQRINGINITNHYRSLSHISKRRFCREPAQALIFNFLLSITITNCVLLMRKAQKKTQPSNRELRYTQADFKEALFKQLITRFYAQAEQQREPTIEQIKRDSPRAPKPTTTNPNANHTLHSQGHLHHTRCKAYSRRFKGALNNQYNQQRQGLKTT